MEIKIEITEKELRQLVLLKLQSILGSVVLKEEDVVIQTKSNQNYKAEWETAAFRATVSKFNQ